MNNLEEQQPFFAEFAENPEPRCPCLLLLDTSGSMNGRPIQELNSALLQFKHELMSDSMATKRVEIAVITFGPVKLLTDFVSVDQFFIPSLTSQADTPLGSAISTGLELIRQRKEILRNNGIKLYRPWIFLITDGVPNDNWQKVIPEIKAGEENRSFSFFALAVEGANLEILKQISLRDPIKLKGLRFTEFFQWLSASLKSVSRSMPGDRVSLPDYKPYGWADV